MIDPLASTPGEFTLRDCFVRIDENGIWIEALHMDAAGVTATIERCNFHIETAVFGKDYAFAFDHDRDRLEMQDAAVRILCGRSVPDAA